MPYIAHENDGVYADAFVDLVRNHQKEGMVVLEVGCFDGATTSRAIVAVAQSNGEYIVVDHFRGTKCPGWETNPGTHVYKEDKYVRPAFEASVSNYSQFCTIVEMDVADAANIIRDESIDICYIDADHAYHAVKRDIDLFLPKVKTGGIIAGHDFDDLSEDFHRTKSVLSISDERLFLDHLPCGLHLGVVRAVYEKFGENINRVPNKQPSPPIWWKYKE